MARVRYRFRDADLYRPVRSEHGLQKTKCMNGVHEHCEINIKIQLTENVLDTRCKEVFQNLIYMFLIYYVTIKKIYIVI